MEIDWELRNKNKLKEDGSQETTLEHSPIFVDILEIINKSATLKRPMPSPILERGTVLKRQEVKFSALQFFI